MTDTPLTTANIMHGDALTRLAELPANSVHAVITDPPYGMTSHTDTDCLLDAWLNRRVYQEGGPGYAGNDWDNSVPGPELWRAAMRVLIPGGFILAFSAARTAHLTATAMALAGLDIRDTYHWTYPTSRMASRDLGKQVRQEYGDEAVAAQLDGARATLRPAHEPIIVARAPLLEDTLLDNVITLGTGAIRHRKGQRPYTNLLATHEPACQPEACITGCPITANLFGAETTHIYPGEHLPGPTLRCDKPGKSERPVAEDGTRHDTVKPLALTRLLVRAYTRPGDTVLDPFLGSGTTAEAALLEQRNVVGCEMTADYHPLIEHRIARARDAAHHLEAACA